MPPESESSPKVEIAHVLTMDVVEYSTLLITEQSRIMAQLTEIVQSTARFRQADAEDKLLRLPTGDGMALVFFNDSEAPIECAMEISAAVKAHPHIRLRMGIHSGPVNQIVDVNNRSNIAGAGIDVAQRVMDCGDAGHILLSKRVADDLAPYPRWNPHLHDLGECEVKHGRKVSLVNFYNDKIGNPEPPNKCQEQKGKPEADGHPRSRRLTSLSFVAAALLAFIALGLILFRWVGTPLRRGAVRVQSDAQDGRRSAASLPSSKSIAVLPFENLSHDPENAYFADGIQEEILTRLSKIADLKVISRTSTQRYKSAPTNLSEIAKQLGVAHILEGTVQKAADQVRVNVQLINAENDSHVWADKFDRKLTDIFAVESEIATKIAAALQAKLTGAEQRALASRPTENSEAHQLYLKGLYFWNKKTPDGHRKSIEYFNQAIEKDPNYALAYAGLADTYLGLPFDSDARPREAFPKAEAAAERSLAIDNTLAEAHASLAWVKFNYEWDFSGAEEGLTRAIALNPNYALVHNRYARYLSVMGRHQEAVADAKRARELDPLSLIINTNVGQALFWARQYDQVIEELRKTLEIDSNFWVAHLFLGKAYEQKAMYPEAIAALQKARELSGGSSQTISMLGYVYAVSGRRSEAQHALDELNDQSKQRYVPPYDIAMVYAGLGERDQFFQWLEKAYEDRNQFMTLLKVEPKFDPIRSDPRFQDLLRRVGLQ
jgi:TolB-like protein/Flp pilus assembly protein TadD